MKLEELDYKLPEDLIAQYPQAERDKCKLLIYTRKKDTIEHKLFYNIIEYLHKDDILIFNDTKVFPARIYGVKETGKAKIEFLLLKRLDEKRWESLIRPGKRIKDNTVIILKDRDNNILDIKVKIIDRKEDGIFIIEFSNNLEYKDFNHIGHIPLPPYIRRDDKKNLDDRYYQTVYAKKYGAVAAPTAGFHFTESLINMIKEKGVKIGYITLHIGWDTFAPIREEEVEKHKIHKEYIEVSDETVKLINNRKGRCIAVGTTVVRALESVAIKKGMIQEYKGWVDTYILPDYDIKIVDALITNFHLPKSTLLLLVSAFVGLDKLKFIYKIAIDKNYRFFSYGDAMFIQ